MSTTTSAACCCCQDTAKARYQALLFFGGPGTGKGTQGKVLGSLPGFHHCATGDIFRSLDKTTELGKLFLSFSTKGLLVPDDVTVRIWAQAMQDRVARKEFDPARTLLIMDGIPRTVEQARLLEPHIQVLKIVHLACDDAAPMLDRMKKRALKEGRPDDADPEVVRKRWSVYESQTLPVLGHYPASLVARINPIGTPGQVLLDILKAITPLEKALQGE